MDLHPYDIVRHDTTHHDNCHAHMHGLIHDGRLWVIMPFKVNVALKVNVHS
jgi:hypothetical protein